MKLFRSLAVATLIGLPLISLAGCSLDVDRGSNAYYDRGYNNGYYGSGYGYRSRYIAPVRVYDDRRVIVPERNRITIER